MRTIVGFGLLIVGLTIAAYAYYPETVQNHVSLAKVTHVIAPVDANARALMTDARAQMRERREASPRSYSPGPLLLAGVDRLAQPSRKFMAPLVTASISRDKEHEKSAPARVTSTQTSLHKGGWTAVVTPAVSPRSGVLGARELRSSMPADGSSRYALIRDIQRELKRVGCYWGKIDGDWGPASKYAIDEFIRTVNATLPTRDPDYILLALVRAQNSQVCGTSIDRDRVITARADRVEKPGVRRSLEAPRLVAAPRPARRLGEKQFVAVTPPKPVAALPGNGHAYRATLPGRMAVGGPRPSALPATKTAPGASALPATTRAKPSAETQARRDRASASKKRARRAAAKKSRRASRRSYRRRNRNPLANLLRQGVY